MLTRRAFVQLGFALHSCFVFKTVSAYRLLEEDIYQIEGLAGDNVEDVYLGNAEEILDEAAGRDNQTHRCGYKNEDMDNEDQPNEGRPSSKNKLQVVDSNEVKRNKAGERKYDFTDPRAGTGWSSGIMSGFAARFLGLMRGIFSSRVIALEVTGDQASQIVQAQYGIVTAAIPVNCFAVLKEQLNNGGLTIAQVEAKREQLRDILKVQLPRNCSGGEVTKEGNAAAAMLKALLYGYWSVYEPETVQSASVISARNLNPVYVDNGDLKLRQTWHFGKLHMLQKTMTIVRRQMIKAASRAERQRLRITLVRVQKLMSMKEAQLSFIELDRLGSCISAGKHNVATLLDALKSYESARFRATLFFRERWMIRMVHKLKNPVYSAKRWGGLMADEWNRFGINHKIGMIVKPMLKTAAIAGIVLGVCTGGSSTFASVFVEHALGQAIFAQQYLQTSFLMLAIKQLVQAPIVAYVTDLSMAEGMNSLFFARFLVRLEEEPAVQDVRTRLVADVERIMSSEQIVAQLKAYHEDGAKGKEEVEDFDVTSLEQEIRRIVSDIVYSGFVNEVTPVIEDYMMRERQKSDPMYGWLHWDEHQKFREAKTSKGLVGTRLKWVGDGQHWTGKVVKVTTNRLCLGLCDRTIVVETNGVETKMKLSSKLKAHVLVYDPPAYHRSKPGWLLWSDWAEYRVTNDAKELVQKEIHIDVSLWGCERWKGHCSTILDPNGHGVVVTGASWKFFGLGDRTLYLNIGDRKGCSEEKSFGKFALNLTSELKKCLRVNDGHAYEKFIRDAPRREQEQRWKNGSLSAAHRIEEDVLDAMACAPNGNRSLKERAESGNTVLRDKVGMSSMALELQSEGETNGDDDPEVRKVNEEAEQAFTAANKGRCVRRKRTRISPSS